MRNLHGLVVGYFSEASEDVHHLIQSMAESRVACADLNRRKHGESVRAQCCCVADQEKAECGRHQGHLQLSVDTDDADRGGDKRVTEEKAMEGQGRENHETRKRSSVAQKNSGPRNSTQGGIS